MGLEGTDIYIHKEVHLTKVLQGLLSSAAPDCNHYYSNYTERSLGDDSKGPGLSQSDAPFIRSIQPDLR